MGWEDWIDWDREMSPEVDRREQQKIPWLADGAVDLSDPSVHTIPAGSSPYTERRA